MWVDATSALRAACRAELGPSAEKRTQNGDGDSHSQSKQNTHSIKTTESASSSASLPHPVALSDATYVRLAPTVTLSQAMSAFELGDARMDQGMRSASVMDLKERMLVGGDAGPDSVNKGGIPPAEGLSDSETIAVMDRLLVAFCEWLAGSTLSQTLWTCLYAQNPAALLRSQHPVLNAFVVGLLKATDAARLAIARAEVHYEEDTSPVTFGMDLAEGIPEAEALEMIHAALKAVAANDTRMRARINVVLSLYTGLRALDIAPGMGEAALEEAVRPFGEALTALKTIQSEHSSESQQAGKIVPAEVPAGVFDARLVYRSRVPGPAFVVEFRDVKTNFAELSETLSGLENLRRLSTCQSLEAFEWLFDDVSSRRHNAVVTAHLWMLFLCPQRASAALSSSTETVGTGSDETANGLAPAAATTPDPRARMRVFVLGGRPLASYIADSVLAFWLVDRQADLKETGGDVSKRLFAADEALLDAFALDMEPLVIDSFRLLCTNSARQRRLLAHVVQNYHFQFWKTAVSDRELQLRELAKVSSPIFFLWLGARSSAQIQRVLQLGFELELYSPHELASIYWYLDYLLGFRISQFAGVNEFYLTLRGSPAFSRYFAHPEVKAMFQHRSLLISSLEAQKDLQSVLFRAWCVFSHCAALQRRPSITAADVPRSSGQKSRSKAAKPNARKRGSRGGRRRADAVGGAANGGGGSQVEVDLRFDVASSFPLGSDFLRYYQRFGLFANVSSPEVLPEATFRANAVIPTADVGRLLANCSDSFKLIRERLDAVVKQQQASNFDLLQPFYDPDLDPASLRGMMRVCIMHGLTFANHAVKLGESKDYAGLALYVRRVQLDTSVHKYFAVPRLL